MTMRDLMAVHRERPLCASCHARMDPLGLALENFDGIGHWRTADLGSPIDSSGAMQDGTKVTGPSALIQSLTSRPDQFARTVTEMMMTYALGRGTEYYDMPAIRAVVKSAGPKNYRFSSIVLGIVNSPPFQMRVK